MTSPERNQLTDWKDELFRIGRTFGSSSSH